MPRMDKIKTGILLIVVGINLNLHAQTDYQMNSGETIYVGPDGKILGSSNPDSKYNTGIKGHSTLKMSDYNEDGSPKLPGYSPSGNKEVDAQNYKKAKLMFYRNDPEGFKKWQKKYSNPPHEGHVQDIKKEEFEKLPPAKQKLILSESDKYEIVK